ncbi:MAG: UV radiation resistance protein and autophagy-related subunit 14-domain-containing protein [Benniella sp.]|nr:MAG: UV radiation resistance protein and autophagy-related subunit 14-domain-containing protein [Benniella sp.]
MDMSQTRLKHRPGLEPTQRRIRHIQCIQARNLTFTQNANQRTLASVLLHQSTTPYQYDTQFSHSSLGSNGYISNSFLLPSFQTRPATPSLEPPSGASSPTKSYFKSPWKGYYQGIPKVRGPGSDTGSVSASESGRGATSVIKEPIARLSAGIKATVFSAGNSLESGYTSETGSASGANVSKSKPKARYRFSVDQSVPRPASVDGKRQQQQQLEEPPSSGRLSKEWTSTTTTPATSLTSARDKFLLAINDSVLRGAKDNRVPSPSASTRNQRTLPDINTEDLSRLPPFVSKSRDESLPLLLDTYFTLHDQENDQVIYTSETVMGSNNPNYNPLEEHLFADLTRRRSNNVNVRIWAGHRGSDFFLLLEWRVDLCCLRYIGKELRDLPTSLPNNMILFGFENGYYTAPDDDDMAEHPHLSLLEPISMTPGTPVGIIPSYTYDAVMRLNNLHECIADTRHSRDEIKHNLEAGLNRENASMIMHKRRGEWTERLWHVQQRVTHEIKVHEAEKKKATALRRDLDRRRQALAESQERGQTQAMYLEENMLKLAKNKESLYNVLQEYSTKRTELIATLFTIFPITESEGDPNLLKICNVPLPNSVYTGMDEESISIALGHACNLIVMLAHYLSVPLRYPLTPMGSRAFVLDPVSRLVGPKEFPLFGKGQDTQRFEYGVFLLNKNIEQLLNSQGLQFMDLRQTLPNLRYLMETLLTTSPSQSMLIRSKLFSRRKQLSQEHERLANLVVIPIEQREPGHVLDPEIEGSSTDGNEVEKPGPGPRLHERIPSTSKSNTSERSSLMREYDPIEGDYMLILDNAPRSRNDTGGNDISAIRRIGESHTGIRVTSPRTDSSHHNNAVGEHQQGFLSNTNLNGTDEEVGRSVDDPAFRDWAIEGAVNVQDNHLGVGISENSGSSSTPSIEQCPSPRIDSKFTNRGFNGSGSGTRADHKRNKSRKMGGTGKSHGTPFSQFWQADDDYDDDDDDDDEDHQHPEDLFGNLSNHSSRVDFTSSTYDHGDRVSPNESDTGTDGDSEVDHQSMRRASFSPPAKTSEEASKEPFVEGHVIENQTMFKPRRASSGPQNQPSQQQQQQHGLISSKSAAAAFSSTKQRFRRLSDRLGTSVREESSTGSSKEMIRRHKQPSPTTTTSSIMEASG